MTLVYTLFLIMSNAYVYRLKYDTSIFIVSNSLRSH